MPDSSVIAYVSLTGTILTNAFSTILPGPPVAEVHDLQGAIPTTPARMTIFLFEAVEDPTVRNQRRPREIVPPNIAQRRPQVPLILRYLLTPWGGDRATEHLLLGRALQTLHDDAILSGPQLQGGLAGSSEALKLKLAPLTLEDRVCGLPSDSRITCRDLRGAGHPHRSGRRGWVRQCSRERSTVRSETAHDVHRDSVGAHDRLQPDRPASRG